MSSLHFEVLDSKRLKVFHALAKLTKRGLLGGGTALALYVGHRRSHDFDIFLKTPIEQGLLNKINKILPKFDIRPSVDTPNELSIFLDNQIKLTFLHFPFLPLYKPTSTISISLYSIPDLASNKVYVIGRRGEWKDYVDLYFLLRKGLAIDKIITEAKKRFTGNFDERIFWEQLVYWKDLRSFKVEYIKETVAKEEIQKYFEEITNNKLRAL